MGIATGIATRSASGINTAQQLSNLDDGGPGGPSFGGINFFGPCPVMEHDDPANAEQISHFPGTIGVERLDLGTLTSTTIVRGILVETTPGELGQTCAAIRGFKDNGGIATLVDTDGTPWPDAILHRFRTVGRTSYAPGWGYAKEYEMEFLHIGYNPNR